MKEYRDRSKNKGRRIDKKKKKEKKGEVGGGGGGVEEEAGRQSEEEELRIRLVARKGNLAWRRGRRKEKKISVEENKGTEKKENLIKIKKKSKKTTFQWICTQCTVELALVFVIF